MHDISDYVEEAAEGYGAFYEHTMRVGPLAYKELRELWDNLDEGTKFLWFKIAEAVIDEYNDQIWEPPKDY